MSDHLIEERRAKLDALREQGQAYPNHFRREHFAQPLHAQYDALSKEELEEKSVSVTVAGRMMAKRVMGKASFVQIQDMSGRLQLFLQRDAIGQDLYQAFKGWDVGDVVAASGALFKTKTDELSVRVDTFEMLVKSLRPLPEKFHGLVDREARYRRRYLDLVMNAESKAVFVLRSKMMQFMRSYLDQRHFLEVETPMMQVMAGGAVAKPFVTHHNALDMPLYLRIAPELYLKRLVVGGFEQVYEINRNFRNEGLSTRHNPEFTMLELYQAYADCDMIMALTEQLISDMAQALLPSVEVKQEQATINLQAPFHRVALEQATLEACADIKAEKVRDRDHLVQVCQRHGVKVVDSYGPGKLIVELFEKHVEPNLSQPTFVTGYPLEVSPLARKNDEDPYLTDRFELFIDGKEIANGFSELNDPDDQAQRFRAQLEQREGGDDEAMMYDDDYVQALEYGMPPTGGLGVGVDRLVMLFAGVSSIRDVVLFPHMRKERGDEEG